MKKFIKQGIYEIIYLAKAGNCKVKEIKGRIRGPKCLRIWRTNFRLTRRG
jgi:hypothetical protein